MSQLNLISPSQEFQKPKDFEISQYINEDGYTIRYGHLKSKNEHAVIILLGGQTQFIEMDFENAIDLVDIGISFYTVERVGDGGSQRLYKDPQKPPAVNHDIYVRDLHKFLSEIIDLPDDKPVLLAGQCLGGLVALKYVATHPGIIDHCIPTAPLFGLKWQGANSLTKRFGWAIRDITPDNQDRYIGKARDWSWELAQKLIANDVTSHDYERASLHHKWRRINPSLQEGGFTEGNMIQISRSLIETLQANKLKKIKTPVTVISPTEDAINNPDEHAKVARLLKHGKLVSINGARHGIWRESDFFRDQLLTVIKRIAAVETKKYIWGWSKPRFNP